MKEQGSATGIYAASLRCFTAARKLVGDRFLLQEDADRYVQAAREARDIVAGQTARR